MNWRLNPAPYLDGMIIKLMMCRVPGNRKSKAMGKYLTIDCNVMTTVSKRIYEVSYVHYAVETAYNGSVGTFLISGIV